MELTYCTFVFSTVAMCAKVLYKHGAFLYRNVLITNGLFLRRVLFQRPPRPQTVNQYEQHNKMKFTNM